ncbi:hypothetical protein HYC85_003058 [Camellia sinensis]|uniref:Cyclin N-terminal domain-containing protein n=1 Tax=Camellia sinensis TaxID=4442 RepID=A0A7J7IA76_CAMSI|nr:hypothetical protein HYC85_003058 [Camellia sinensis]
MAANFWTSSHYKQLLDQEEVDVVQPLDREKGITLEDFKIIKMHMANYIGRLAQSVKVRQSWLVDVPLVQLFLPSKPLNQFLTHLKILVITTGTHFIHHNHNRKLISTFLNLIKTFQHIHDNCKLMSSLICWSIFQGCSHCCCVHETCIYQVAPTCLYLASKAEESTVQARLLLPSTCHFCVADLDERYRYEIKDILEMEMKILEALNYYLVVFHPYRALPQLLQDAGMNDLACIYVASVLKDKESTAWFEELRVEMNVVKNIAMEILDFYDSHKMITEERINASMNKLALRQ